MFRRALGRAPLAGLLIGAAVTSACAGEPATAPASGPVAADGIHVHALQTLESSYVWYTERPAAPGQPITIVGARNGRFSGRLVVSALRPIRGLAVQASSLTRQGGAGTIPNAIIQVRYSEPADRKKSWSHTTSQFHTHEGRFDALVERAPTEVPVRDVAVPRGAVLPESYAAPVPGAVQPVWITVRIPADAAPGDYIGTVAVRADGLASTEFPLRLKVIDWRIPDPKDFTVHHSIYQSHDSVALYYRAPLWSDRHFELMGKSLALTKDAGNKICVVHLIADAFCMGNAQSMVRWVKKGRSEFGVRSSGYGPRAASGGGPSDRSDSSDKPDRSDLQTPTSELHGGSAQYDYDFTVFDRYLDVYGKTVGTPGLVLLSVWARGGDGDRTISFGKEIDMPVYARRPRHQVTRLDPATGKVELMDQPPYGTPESVAFWRPVLAGIRTRLEKRGWFAVTAIGSGGDAVPLPTTVSGFKEIWPDVPWMSISHTNPTAYKAKDGTTVPVVYSEHVWGAGRLYNPDASAPRTRAGGGYPAPWTRGAARIEWGFPRIGVGFIDHLFDSSPVVAWRFATEAAIQGNLNGVARIGADFWPIPQGPRGKYDHITGTTNLGPAYSTLAILSPGPDGAVPTERYEMLCEGVQVAEAVIALKKALGTGRLRPDLAQRCEALLDGRARRYYRVNTVRKTADDLCNWKVLEAAGWQTYDEQLFTLAAEVAKELGGK